MKARNRHQRLWHRLFQLGMIIKGLDGLAETFAGLMFLLVSSGTLVQIIFSLTQHELIEDPDDWIANHLRYAFAHLSSGNKLFAAVYLLGHGLLKGLLVVGMGLDKLWAFPAGLSVLAGFVAYQSWRLAQDFSWALLVLTVFDVCVIALVWREYREVKGGHGHVRQ